MVTSSYGRHSSDITEQLLEADILQARTSLENTYSIAGEAGQLVINTQGYSEGQHLAFL